MRDIKDLIYWHYENEYGLLKELILERPDKFADLLWSGASHFLNIVKEPSLCLRTPKELGRPSKKRSRSNRRDGRKPSERALYLADPFPCFYGTTKRLIHSLAYIW